MANDNLRIIHSDPPKWLPSHLADSDGLYSFDLFSDTNVAITKEIDDSDILGKIKQDTVRNFTLPNTLRNRALIGDIGSPNAFQLNHYKSIPVRIESGGLTLPEQTMKVRATGDQPFEVEVYGVANEWISAIDRVKIKDLNWPDTPAYNWSLIDDLHQNNYEYDGTNKPYNIPYANYGKRILRDRISLEDLRIWHSLLFILQEGFCEAGWKFICPFLETSYGRRLWCYLLSENFAGEDAAANKGFNAKISADYAVADVTSSPAARRVIFDDDSTSPAYDTGGFFDTVNSEFSGTNLRGNWRANVRTIGSTNPLADNWYIVAVMYKENITSGIRVEMARAELFNPSGGTKDLLLVADNVVVNNQEKVYIEAVQFDYPVDHSAIKSYFTVEPLSTGISEGDIISTGDIIQEDYSILDILKGSVHLFNLKVDTDVIRKTVSFYPEDKAESFYNEGTIEGFFYETDRAKNWTDRVQCDSLKIDLKANKNKRNYLLEFKEDSGDHLAKNTGFEFPLHSKNIDFGIDFDEGTTKNSNPFFAPTINQYDFDISYTWEVFGPTLDTAPYIPFILKSEIAEDGTLPTPATKVIPRILLAREYGRMLVPESDETGPATVGDIQVHFTTAVGGLVVKAFYPAFGQIFPEGFRAQGGGAPFDIDDEAVVYGSDEYYLALPDNYRLLYKRAIDRLYKSAPVELLIKLSFVDFINLSPRDRIFIEYVSNRYGRLSFYSRVYKITDHVVNKEIATPILLQPSDMTFDQC